MAIHRLAEHPAIGIADAAHGVPIICVWGSIVQTHFCSPRRASIAYVLLTVVTYIVSPTTTGPHWKLSVYSAVRQVIGGAVDAGEVIDLFAAAGLDAGRLDILSEDFLSRVAALEQKNLALETLRKLLNDQIRTTERTNLVQSRKFREALEQAMLGYTNKQISTAEMIAQLLELAKWVRDAKQHGHELGLTDEETAFYDALAENSSAKQVMKSDTLRLMALELSEMVKKMPKLDWTQRESVRADLRRHVRRLLAKFCPAGLVGRRDATRAKASRAVDVSQRGVGSPLSAPTSRFSAAVVAPAPLPLPSASREFREPSAGSTPRAGADADAADQLPHPLRLAAGVAGVPAGLPAVHLGRPRAGRRGVAGGEGRRF